MKKFLKKITTNVVALAIAFGFVGAIYAATLITDQNIWTYTAVDGDTINYTAWNELVTKAQQFNTACSSDGQVDCKSVTAFKATDATKLIPENITKDVVIAGVTGTHVGQLPDCTSEGEQACTAAGTFKAGTHNNGTTVAPAISLGATGKLLVKAVAGFFDGVDDMLEITDLDFIAANIKSGINLFGITGTASTGTNLDNIYVLNPARCGDGVLQADKEWSDAGSDVCERIPDLQLISKACTDLGAACTDGTATYIVKVALMNPTVVSTTSTVLSFVDAAGEGVTELVNTCNNITLNEAFSECTVEYTAVSGNRDASFHFAYAAPDGKEALITGSTNISANPAPAVAGTATHNTFTFDFVVDDDVVFTDLVATEEASTNMTVATGSLVASADNASWNSTANINGGLTISNSTTTGFTAVEDITGKTTMYVLNTENTADYLAVTGTVAGTVGSQIFTYTTPQLSAATAASEETKWVSSQLVISDKPKEITVDASTTTTSLEAYTPIATGDELIVYNATDGAVERTAGTVTVVNNSNGIALSSFTDTSITAADGRTTLTTAGLWHSARSSNVITQDKVYFEVACSGTATLGISTGFILSTETLTTDTDMGVYASALGASYGGNGWGTLTDGAFFTYVAGDNIGVAADYLAGIIKFYKNNVYQCTMSGLTRNHIPIVSVAHHVSAVAVMKWTSVQQTYTAPVGYTSVDSAVKYSAPITATSIPTTKAFFNNPAPIYSLAVEDTAARAVVVPNENLVVDASSTSTSLVTSNLLTEGETITVGNTTDGYVDEVVGTISAAQTSGVFDINFAQTDSIFSNKNTTQTTSAVNAWSGLTYLNNNSVSGKYFMEINIDTKGTDIIIGVSKEKTSNTGSYLGSRITDYTYHSTGKKLSNNIEVDISAPYTSGDKVGIAYDATTGYIHFYKNGTLVSGAYAYAVSPGTSIYFAVSNYGNSVITINNTPTYPIAGYILISNSGYSTTITNLTTAPTSAYRKGGEPLTFISSTTSEYVGTNPISGLLKTGDTIQLNGAAEVVTTNVVEEMLGSGLLPNNEFETVLYTGNGATQTVNMTNITTGVDFVWIKQRTGTYNNTLFDSIRGQNRLVTNTTDAENAYTALSSFNADSFSLGIGDQINLNTGSFVAWVASLPNKNPTNTAGTITSNTMSNSFMSAVSYLDNNGVQSVGHGLSQKPQLTIIKSRDNASGAWYVNTDVIDSSFDELYLDTTAAKYDRDLYAFTATTIPVFIGQGNMIAYAFTSVAGTSKVGTYTGTGAAGNVVTTGFEPAWVMIKNTSVVESWVIFDNARQSGSNDGILYPNLANAEALAFDYVNFTSTGFTVQETGVNVNGNGNTLIYLAIAKNTTQSIPQYTASFAAQVLAPTSAKVLDRSTLLTGTRTYNAANNNFDFTSTVTNVSGRACKIKASVEKTGSSVLSPITLHMTKKAN